MHEKGAESHLFGIRRLILFTIDNGACIPYAPLRTITLFRIYR